MGTTGVVFGRFQIMHIGYMEYILAARMRCDRLIIGIANPDTDHILYNRFQNGSLREKNNPFTYFERMEMIEASMRDFNVPREDYDIVPFPMDDPSLLANYAPVDAVYYMMVLDDWGREKKDMLEDCGYPVEVIKYGSASDKRASSHQVLEKLAHGGNWKSIVPRGVAAYILDNDLDVRVRALWNKPDRDDDGHYTMPVPAPEEAPVPEPVRKVTYTAPDTDNMPDKDYSDNETPIRDLARRYDDDTWEQKHPRRRTGDLDLI